MIELHGSRFSDIMPDNLAKQPEVLALAHAVGKQIEKLCEYADNARTYAAIMTMPERVLDALAVELRTPAYDETFPASVKRELVAGTLTFFMTRGTPAACDRIIEIIFGSGYIEEWYQYGGEPHHFRAYVGLENTGTVDPENLEEFRRVLDGVKRLSSWMDDVIAISTFDPEILYTTSNMGRGYMKTTLPEMLMDYQMEQIAAGTGGLFTSMMVTRLNEKQPDYHMKNTPARACGVFASITITALPAAN